MLEYYFSRPKKLEALRQNVLAPFLMEAASRFKEQAYPPRYAHKLLCALAHFGSWLGTQQIALTQVTLAHSAEFVREFIPPKHREVHYQGCPVYTGELRAASRLAVRMIHEKYPPAHSPGFVQVEVGRYVQHLAQNRGLAAGSIEHHQRQLEQFLSHSFRDQEIVIAQLNPADIRKYIAGLATLRQQKLARTVLRGYFRFLELHRVPVRHLLAGLPDLPRFRPALSPMVLSLEQLDRFLKAIDRSTAVGKRNYAVALCLSDLGMRIGDIARLTLEDLDWREGSVRVANHKKDRPFRLPLSRRLGEALADYLQHGRPPSLCRQVFLRHRRPVGDPATHHSLKSAMQSVWKNAGVDGPFSGTHILRHSAATRMKQQGIPLKSIADVLGHGSLQTTMLYTQVDLPALRMVAQPWPGEQS